MKWNKALRLPFASAIAQSHMPSTVWKPSSKLQALNVWMAAPDRLKENSRLQRLGSARMVEIDVGHGTSRIQWKKSWTTRNSPCLSVKAPLGTLAKLCGIYYDWREFLDQPNNAVLYVGSSKKQFPDWEKTAKPGTKLGQSPGSPVRQTLILFQALGQWAQSKKRAGDCSVAVLSVRGSHV